MRTQSVSLHQLDQNESCTKEKGLTFLRRHDSGGDHGTDSLPVQQVLSEDATEGGVKGSAKSWIAPIIKEKDDAHRDGRDAIGVNTRAAGDKGFGFLSCILR